ncbi:hypothetical protein PILCRDRAFT_825528 [Piloderma croceum F 1598]|uniref:Uncharacterized protein n=1 Tax=Piloderma croceum (strain F 1598) TaxID=765440 RepID=A0A0C3EXD7_PILCF|nr:hypothetical protein PILCRDRAFT_825528 [Piloderma croceum F 1598]
MPRPHAISQRYDRAWPKKHPPRDQFEYLYKLQRISAMADLRNHQNFRLVRTLVEPSDYIVQYDQGTNDRGN